MTNKNIGPEPMRLAIAAARVALGAGINPLTP